MIEQVEQHAAHDRARVAGHHLPQVVELGLERALVLVPGDAAGAREHLVGDVVVELERERRSVAEAVEHPRHHRDQEAGEEAQRRRPAPRLRRPAEQQRRDPGGQQRHRVVAGQEGERREQPGPERRASRGAGQQHAQGRGLERVGERVGGRRVAVAEEEAVGGDEQHAEQRHARVGAAREQAEPQPQARGRRRHRDQLGGEEQVAHHEPDQRQHQLVDRPDHAVAGRDQPAVLDEPGALGVVAVEVGLGEVVADLVRPQRDGEQA